MLVIFTPKEAVKKFVNDNYGPVTYEALGENESLGGVITTRNKILSVRAKSQTYEFGDYGRPIFNPERIEIKEITNSKSLPRGEQIRKREQFIKSSQIFGPKIKNYSGILGEWGDNPRTEPRTRKIREIYVLCKNCDIPIWICDTLEPVLNWGESEKVGFNKWLKENYQRYLGFPLYKIPPINFSNLDLKEFPKIEKELIEQGKLNECNSLAEQNIVLLQEACKIFGLEPILIDQKKLRDVGAYRNGINTILKKKEELEKKFGKQNLFRVECPRCGKYIYNVELEGERVKGICEGKVKAQITGEMLKKYDGCGNILDEKLDYLYSNAIPNGKILTSIYMSNSQEGIFFPDKEFVPENVATGELEKMVLTTGEIFNSGIPEIIKTGWFTYDGDVENIFRVLDYIPAKDLIERFGVCPTSERRININKKAIEPFLVNKLKNFNPPADPRLIADVLYSLNAENIDIEKLGWSLNGNDLYVIELLRCLGNVRQNKVLENKPNINWTENYQTFMNERYLPEKEIEKLRESMTDKNSRVKTIMETAYLGTLVNSNQNLLNSNELNKLKEVFLK